MDLVVDRLVQSQSLSSRTPHLQYTRPIDGFYPQFLKADTRTSARILHPIVVRPKHSPSSDAIFMERCSDSSHLLSNMAHSSAEREWRTLQKKAWLLATRSRPSLTGMLNTCVAYSRAEITPSLRSISGHFTNAWAILSGSLVSSRRHGPMSRCIRT